MGFHLTLPSIYAMLYTARDCDEREGRAPLDWPDGLAGSNQQGEDMEMRTVRVWVLVDAHGDAVACAEHTELDHNAALCEEYDRIVGGETHCPRRLIRIDLAVPLRGNTALEATVPAEGTTGELFLDVTVRGERE